MPFKFSIRNDDGSWEDIRAELIPSLEQERRDLEELKFMAENVGVAECQSCGHKQNFAIPMYGVGVQMECQACKAKIAVSLIPDEDLTITGTLRWRGK